MRYLFVITLISLLGVGCANQDDTKTAKTWTAFYYPDIRQISDETTWSVQPGLETLDACLDWVTNRMLASHDRDFDYECGYNCRYDEDFKTTVCERTEK